MKDSYDPLDWSKGGSSGNGVKHYSSTDYDNYAKNPTYRSDALTKDEMLNGGFQVNGTAEADSYTQADYDNFAQNPTYRSEYYDDQTYDDGYYQQDGYYQDYQDGYQDYQQDYSQQSSSPASDYEAYGQAQPTKYSQEDYDRLAQNPSYRNDYNPYKMEDDEFHKMIVKQKKRDVMQDAVDNYLLAGTFGAKHADAPEFSKDSLLYVLMLGFGAALAKLFSLPLWAYPVFATGIGLLFTAVKAFLIDSESKEEAMKKCLVPGIILGIGFGFTVYMKSRGL